MSHNASERAGSGPVIVTGAAGFAGSYLMNELRRSHPATRVIAVVNSSPASATAETAVLDIRDADLVGQLIAKERPSAVVHLAAVAKPADAKANPKHAWDVNVYGTMNLAEAVLKFAPEASFLHVGSSEVYGESFNLLPDALDETATLRPMSPYGASKAAADIMIGQYACDGLRAIRFRPFNHTGPGQQAAYVVSSLARQIARIERGFSPPLMEVGNLESERHLLDVRDAVRAYSLALNVKDVAPGTALNVSSDLPVSIDSVLRQMLERTKSEIQVRRTEQLVRANDVRRTFGDSSKAKKLLGWQPIIPIEKTIEDVLNYWRSSVSA